MSLTTDQSGKVGGSLHPMRTIVITLLLLIEGSMLRAQVGVWNTAELHKPPNFRWLTANRDSVGQLVYEGLGYGKLPKTAVFAYYATPGILSGEPARDKNLPAVVLVHGGGGAAFKEWAILWAKRGYAAIAMDLSGNGPGGKRLVDGGPDQDSHSKFVSIDSALNTQWTYHSVANVLLAHSLLRSFHEVDTSKTAITGISWGGFLTCIVAGLDSRFKAAVPVYGCGFINQNDGFFYEYEFKYMSKGQKKKWYEQYDPSQYIGKATMPFLWVTGARDEFYQPTIFAQTYQLVRHQSNFRILPDMPHSHCDGWIPPEIGRFIDEKLLHVTPLPVIQPARKTSGGIAARINTQTKIIAATVSYTTDNAVPFSQRKWRTVPAILRRNTIYFNHLPAGATLWLLHVQDERGNQVSSKYYFAF